MKITEVVAALIWRGEKFMICQRPAHKAQGLLWEFVGSKVEPGETKEQALIRECQEELAVTLSIGEIIYGCRPRISRPDGAFDIVQCHHRRWRTAET